MTAAMPAIIAIARIDDGDTAAANGDGDDAAFQQGLDRFQFDDFLRQRRSDHPPPAAPGILNHGPALLFLAALWLRLHP